MSGLAPIHHEGLSIVTETGAGEIVVKLSGTCDSQTKGVLESFLGALHGEAARLGAKRVVVDCENLYFMNSASVKCFLTWLTGIKALPPEKRYTVAVRTNRYLAWQSRSFGAIRRSAPDVFTIDQ